MKATTWILCLFFSGSLWATSGTATDHREPGYVETVLANGLRVALVERRGAGMVAATAIVGAGSALETADFSGASHLLEHLLFNGTSTMTREELYAEVDLIGGYNNAHTDEDHTYYTMLVPALHARRGLEIQAAMLFDSTIPAEVFEKERKIVLEEIARDRSQPDHDLEVALREALWAGSPYARPVIGTYESLAGISRDRVWDYYKSHYVPGTTLLMILGELEVDEMLELVHEVYGPAPAPGENEPLPDPFGARGEAGVRRLELPRGPAVVLLAVPAPGPCDPGGPEAQILAHILDSEAGPLGRTVGKNLVQEVGVSYLPRPQGSALVVRAQVAEGAVPDEVLAALGGALQGVAENGLSEPGMSSGDIARTAQAMTAKRLLEGQRLHFFGMMWADTLGACQQSVGPILAPGEMVEPTPEAVAEAATSLFGELRKRGVGVVAAPEATAAAAMGWPPFPARAEAPAPDAPGTPGADLDRTLANGLRVLVAQEPGSQVTGFHLLIQNRSAREPSTLVGIADVLHRYLPQGSLVSDRSGLSARQERLGVELKTADAEFIPYDDYYTSPAYSFLRLETPSASWLPALELLVEMVRLPALPEEEFEGFLAGRVARAQKNESSPAEVGEQAYREAMLGSDHPLARPVAGTPESLEKIGLAELESFAQSYLAPSGIILSVVGPHHPEEVFGAIADRFGTAHGEVRLPESVPWPLTEDPGPALEVVLGGEQSRIYLGRIAPADAESRPGLRLLSALLTERLGETLREREGLAYRLGASVSFAGTPGRAWLGLEMGTRPDNVEIALEGLHREMQRLRDEMADEREIDRARAVVRSRALMRRMTAVNRARLLGLRAFAGIESTDDLDALDAVDGVTREELAAIARQWLEPSRFRTLIVR